MVLTTARECADRWGVSESMARRILAPLDSVDRDPGSGAMRYDQAEADAARAAQPGRGSRLDLSAEAVTPEHFQRLTADESIPAAHRALWALLWEGGIRLNDALSLDVRDVDLDRHQVGVDYPKRDSDERTVPLSDHTAALAHAAMGDRPEGPFLADGRGAALGRQAVARFARQAAKANIHAFRAGGQEIRRDVGPPRRVKYPSTWTEPEAEGVDNPCHCACSYVHAHHRSACEGTADPSLLVDVVIEFPVTGKVKDRRLRPFCQSCYDAIWAEGYAEAKMAEIAKAERKRTKAERECEKGAGQSI